uniref:BTB/POZ domain-containing protein 6 n=1 Tax=Cacopsylla melanoneura TaxID=428564 RepID=A0A8D8ZSZ8_9HEMI
MTLKMVSSKLLFNYCEHDILKTMYNNEDFCDMAFIVDSTRIPVNRAIISAASSVFKTMLLGSFQDAKSKEIPIPDVSKESFEHFIKYIYGTGMQIDSLKLKEILDLVKLSHCYDLQNLFAALKTYLSHLDLTKLQKIMFSASSSVKLMNTANTYYMHDLYNKIFAVIQSSSTSLTNFMNDPKFVDLSLPVLSDLVQSDYSNTDEIVILKAVLRWIESNNVSIDDKINGNITDNGYELPPDSTIAHESDAIVSKDVKPNVNIVEALLKQIRLTWISLPLYLSFSKDPLFKKYGHILDPSDLCEKYACKPRKQLHYRRFRLKCDNYRSRIDQASSYYGSGHKLFTSSTDVKNDKFTLEVLISSTNNRNELVFKLVLDKIKCATVTTEHVPSNTIEYSLVLKSYNPFKSDHIIVDRETHSLGSTQSPKCIHCYPTPQKLVSTTKWSTTFLDSHPDYVENNSFKLEAVIQYIDHPEISESAIKEAE